MGSLPDTFAGGQFNLPLKVAKLVRLAETDNEHERDSVRRKIWGFGYFLDKAGIIWGKDKVPEFAVDDLYSELSNREK